MLVRDTELLYRKVGTPLTAKEAYSFLLDHIYLEEDFIQWYKDTIDRDKTPRPVQKRFVKGYYNYTLPENKLQRYKNEEKDIREFIKEVRGITNRIVSQYGYDKTTLPSSVDMLGCTLEDFRDWIELQFKPGMSWKNRGSFHIDHKVPLSIARNKREVLALNHFTNLQPLDPHENIMKSDKLLKEHEPLLEKLLGR